MKIKKLVALGDSLTEGYNIDPSKRWTNLLQDKHQLNIINQGISGDTTAGMLARFSNNVLTHQPSHLFIMGGTNDLWLHASIHEVIANLHAIVRQAKYHDIVPIIGIPTPVFAPKGYATDTYFVDDVTLSERMTAFQLMLKQYALEDERLIIDFSDMDAALMLEDGVHPGEEGQIWMMDRMEEVLFS